MYINKAPYWSKFIHIFIMFSAVESIFLDQLKQFFPQKWMESSRFVHQIELSIHDNGHQNFFDVCKDRMYN